jgi:hypothetical protein
MSYLIFPGFDRIEMPFFAGDSVGSASPRWNACGSLERYGNEAVTVVRLLQASAAELSRAPESGPCQLSSLEPKPAE